MKQTSALEKKMIEQIIGEKGELTITSSSVKSNGRALLGLDVFDGCL